MNRGVNKQKTEGLKPTVCHFRIFRDISSVVTVAFSFSTFLEGQGADRESGKEKRKAKSRKPTTNLTWIRKADRKPLISLQETKTTRDKQMSFSVTFQVLSPFRFQVFEGIKRGRESRKGRKDGKTFVP